MAIASPALTLSPSRYRISAIRPLVFGLIAESSPSIRPLSATTFSGAAGLLKTNFQSTIPRTMRMIRVSGSTFRRVCWLTRQYLLYMREGAVGFEPAPFPVFKGGGCASIKRPRSLLAQTGWLVKGCEASFYARQKGAPFSLPKLFLQGAAARDVLLTTCLRR